MTFRRLAGAVVGLALGLVAGFLWAGTFMSLDGCDGSCGGWIYAVVPIAIGALVGPFVGWRVAGGRRRGAAP